MPLATVGVGTPRPRLVLSLLVLVTLLSGIGSGEAVAARKGTEGITVTDFRGTRVSLPRPARRVVCLIESGLSGLLMLGAGDRVVGISTSVYTGDIHGWYSALDDRIRRKSIPTPGNWDFVSLEGVVALKPDLVIIWSQQVESIAALEKRGIPVYGVFLSRLDDVYKEIIDLGVLTGTARRARELNDYTRSELERFSRRVAGISSRRPGVYFMWGQGPLETSGANSTVNELIVRAGGRNVCAHLADEHVVVNLELVRVWNPDVVVMWRNEKRSPAQVMADPQWSPLRACAERRVHQLPDVFLCDLWTLKFQYAVKLVSKWAHPERFRDIDLDAERDRMLKMLYGRTVAVPK